MGSHSWTRIRDGMVSPEWANTACDLRARFEAVAVGVGHHEAAVRDCDAGGVGADKDVHAAVGVPLPGSTKTVDGSLMRVPALTRPRLLLRHRLRRRRLAA